MSQISPAFQGDTPSTPPNTGHVRELDTVCAIEEPVPFNPHSHGHATNARAHPVSHTIIQDPQSFTLIGKGPRKLFEKEQEETAMAMKDDDAALAQMMDICTTTTAAIREDISEALAIVKKLPSLYTAVRKCVVSRDIGDRNADEELAAAEKEISQALSILRRAQKRGSPSRITPESDRS